MKKIILKDKDGNEYVMYGAFSEGEKLLVQKLHEATQERIKGLSFMEAADLLYPKKEE